MEVKTETQLPPREMCCEVDEYIREEQRLVNQSPPSIRFNPPSLQNVPKLLYYYLVMEHSNYWNTIFNLL